MAEIFTAKGGRISDLRPCPFCGGASILTAVADNYINPWCAICVDCSVFIEKPTQESAARAWNKRVKWTDDSLMKVE